MKITRIRDAVAKIPSPMRNAVISFDKMTISLVAVETDVIREGKPVIGYGFCSNNPSIRCRPATWREDAEVA